MVKKMYISLLIFFLLSLGDCYSSEHDEEVFSEMANSRKSQFLDSNILIKEDSAISCTGLNKRLELHSFYRDIYLLDRARSNYIRLGGLLDYITMSSRDSYLKYFDQNKIDLSIEIKNEMILDRSDIYIITHGNQRWFYFPEGAQDFNTSKNRIEITVSNFNLCMGTKIYLVKVSDCNAQNIFDLELCPTMTVEKFFLKTPSIKLTNNNDITLGGKK